MAGAGARRAGAAYLPAARRQTPAPPHRSLGRAFTHACVVTRNASFAVRPRASSLRRPLRPSERDMDGAIIVRNTHVTDGTESLIRGSTRRAIPPIKTRRIGRAVVVRTTPGHVGLIDTIALDIHAVPEGMIGRIASGFNGRTVPSTPIEKPSIVIDDTLVAVRVRDAIGNELRRRHDDRSARVAERPCASAREHCRAEKA